MTGASPQSGETGNSEFPFLVPDRPLERCLPPRIADAVAAHAALYRESRVSVAAVAVCLMAACARTALRPAPRNRRTHGMTFSTMPVLPPGCHRAPWIDHMIAACRPALEFNDALFRSGATGERHNMSRGLIGFPTPNPLINCLRPADLLRNPDPGGASTRLYATPGVSPADDLRRLSPWERNELLRLLCFAWEGEPVVSDDGPRALDAALLLPAEASAAREILAWLDSTITPPPMIMLRCGASPPVPGAALTSFAHTHFIEPIFLGRPATPMPIALGPDADAELERLEAQISARLAELNRPVLSRHLRFVPGLIRRLATLIAALCADRILEPRLDEAECLAMAKGLAFHIAAAHLETLRTMTSGFTATPEGGTCDPAKMIAEFKLLANVRDRQPVARSALRKSASAKQRRDLDRRLASLLEQRKIEIDVRGRLRASREWGG